MNNGLKRQNKKPAHNNGYKQAGKSDKNEDNEQKQTTYQFENE